MDVKRFLIKAHMTSADVLDICLKALSKLDCKSKAIKTQIENDFVSSKGMFDERVLNKVLKEAKQEVFSSIWCNEKCTEIEDAINSKMAEILYNAIVDKYKRSIVVGTKSTT